MGRPKRAGKRARFNQGAKLFAQFLRDNDLSYSEAALHFGISKAYIGHLVTGRMTPSLRLSAKILEITKGAVPCKTWTEAASKT